jgi:integral membrane protein (TIGR00529 family)
MKGDGAMAHIPAIVRIAIIFILILLAIKRKWMLGNAFLGGALGLGILFSMNPLAIAHSCLASMVHPKTLCLTIIVGLILVLSHSLESSGQMVRLLESFRGLVHWPQVNLVIFPALIGLLPMPGGAIFSAPMVKNIAHDQHLSGDRLSYVNYWFRHIWEYWWPLYPGILLTTALANVDLWRLVSFTLPLTLVAVLAGYWPLRDAIAHTGNPMETDGAVKPVKPFLQNLAPIGLVIVGGLGLGMALTFGLSGPIRSVAKELGLIIALIVAIFWVWRKNRMGWMVRRRIIGQPAMVKMLYMVTAILMFKGILEDSGAVGQISQEMLRRHIALMPISMLLPFVVGLVSGITIAFVGATFPILITLIQGMGQSHLMLPYMMLSLASGFIGVLLSPLHLCLLLSNEYFETSLIPVYRHMRLPLAVLLITATGYFIILSRAMG